MGQTLTKEAVLEALRVVEDPDVHKSIVEMEMVKTIEIQGNQVFVEVNLTIPGCPLRVRIEKEVQEAVMALPGVEKVDVVIGTMNDEERQRFAEKLRGKAEEQKPSPLLDPNTKTVFIAVASGKGGVGKSTVTANLAIALANLGLKVGVIDADIYGFSLPNIYGVADVKPAVVENVIMPVQTHGIKLVSMHFFVPENRPVIWRGPMLGKMLRNFFQEVHWSDLDVMLLDLPPGTGDVALDVHQMLPKSKELIVTTPQENAADVAVRAGLMAMHTEHEILGVIENMAYFQCGKCGDKTYLFGRGGGERVAAELQTGLVAQIPVGTTVEGTQGIFATDSQQGEAFSIIAHELAQTLGLQGVTVS